MNLRIRTLVCSVVAAPVLCRCLTNAFPGTANNRPTGIQYSMVDLLAVCSSLLVAQPSPDILTELTARNPGKGREVRVRNGMRSFKPFLPSAIIGNVQSLPSKLDELHSCVQNQQSYRMCGMICFTKTWLHDKSLDNNICIDIMV